MNSKFRYTVQQVYHLFDLDSENISILCFDEVDMFRFVISTINGNVFYGE